MYTIKVCNWTKKQMEFRETNLLRMIKKLYNFVIDKGVYKSVRKWSQPCIRCKKRTICIGERFLHIEMFLALLAIVCKTTMTELLIVAFGDLYVCLCMHILLCHPRLFCRESFNSSKVLRNVMKHNPFCTYISVKMHEHTAYSSLS